MQQRHKGDTESTRPVAGTDASITVTGLTVDRYLELKQEENQLYDLIKRIAACATVNTDTIDKKEHKYREYRQEVMGLRRYDKPLTDQEREKLEELENAWLDEKERPCVTIDGNKVTKLILKYAACGMNANDRERCGYYDGLPDSAKVKIE